jgi:hypothetical protein
MSVNNLAARRGAKANRRKMIVAQKRKSEALEATPDRQAALAASVPIRACLLSSNLFDVGTGTLILARGASVGPAVVGVVLLDTFCRGAKEVFVRTVEGPDLQPYLDRLGSVSPLEAVDPSYARKLLRDLLQWSGGLGFPPPPAVSVIERLFGTVDPDACESTFVFGQNGKPLYVSGPNEPSTVAHRNVEEMRAKLGADGFDYIVALPESELVATPLAGGGQLLEHEG